MKNVAFTFSGGVHNEILSIFRAVVVGAGEKLVFRWKSFSFLLFHGSGKMGKSRRTLQSFEMSRDLYYVEALTDFSVEFWNYSMIIDDEFVPLKFR